MKKLIELAILGTVTGIIPALLTGLIYKMFGL